MSSVRQQILSAVAALIDAPGKPAGLLVGRSWKRVGDLVNEASQVAVVVRPGKEGIETKGDTRTRIADKNCAVLIEVGAAASPSECPDEAMDPAMNWITAQLTKDVTLGGLAKDVREVTVDWNLQDGDASYGRVHWIWNIRYCTDARNPEVKL